MRCDITQPPLPRLKALLVRSLLALVSSAIASTFLSLLAVVVNLWRSIAFNCDVRILVVFVIVAAAAAAAAPPHLTHLSQSSINIRGAPWCETADDTGRSYTSASDAANYFIASLLCTCLSCCLQLFFLDCLFTAITPTWTVYMFIPDYEKSYYMHKAQLASNKFACTCLLSVKLKKQMSVYLMLLFCVSSRHNFSVFMR